MVQALCDVGKYINNFAGSASTLALPTEPIDYLK
jgi:hypothetical protein